MGTPFSYGMSGGNSWGRGPIAQGLIGLMGKKLENQRAGRAAMTAAEIEKERLRLQGVQDTNKASVTSADKLGNYGLQGKQVEAGAADNRTKGDFELGKLKIDAETKQSDKFIEAQKSIAGTNAGVAGQAAVAKAQIDQKAISQAAGLKQFDDSQKSAEALGDKPGYIRSRLPFTKTQEEWNLKRQGIDAKRKHALGLMGVTQDTGR